MGMRFLAVLLSVSVILTGLSSCSSIQLDENKEESLAIFTTKLINASEAEWNLKQIINLGQTEEKQYSHIEYAKNPFNSYLRNGKLTGDSFVIIESNLYNEEDVTYQYLKVEIAQDFTEEDLSVDENGNFSVDSSLMEVDIENKSPVDDRYREPTLKWRNYMELNDIGYLIDKNMVSFKSQDEKINGIEFTRYDGTISVDSIVDMYSDSGRERMEAKLKTFDIESKFKENASKEEKKNELMVLYGEDLDIVEGEGGIGVGVDIAEGIYELVFAEESTPISVWVPINESAPYRIKIEFSNAYMNKQAKLFNSNLENKDYKKTVEYIITLIK